jgi:L-threonylcarbamoyladenylate synthase
LSIHKFQFMSNCSAEQIHSAALMILAGHLVAFPTETVYGLGADACNADAVSRIYSVKGRPIDHPLIVHVSSIDGLSDWAEDVPEYAISLAHDFWPGPLTLVVKRSRLAEDYVTGGQETIGLRVPSHPVALGLLEAFARAGGKGIAAPSANRFGSVSPTTALAVCDEIGCFLEVGDYILDGGASAVGVESTIIDCTGDVPKILRPGAITLKMVETSTGLEVNHEVDGVNESSIRVSGSLDSHYAPSAKVVLDQKPETGQGFIAMADLVVGENIVRLAAPKTHEEFAQVLYSALRSADEQGLETVVVAQPMGDGIAVAIRDRLQRAANPIRKDLK